MKILYVAQYFYPEVCAPSNRAFANAKYFTKKGHDVTVFAQMPNHPKGVIFADYKGKFSVKEKIENFTVIRNWVYISKKKNFLSRIANYLSFALGTSARAILSWKKWDVVYITSPPLFVAYVGLAIKIFFPKAKLVFEVRDLWPQSAIELGELNNKYAIKLSRKLENSIYNKSELIVCLTEGIRYSINKKFPTKTIFIPNGVDLDLYNKVSETDYKKFTVCYTGTLGLIHSLETIIEAARILKKEKNIYFQVIGDGPKREELVSLSKKYGLNSVEFIDSVPIEQIQNYLSKASIGISTTKGFELCKGTIPVKIFGYMACELPVLLSGWGESVEIIKDAECGVWVDPEDAKLLADKILWMKKNQNKIEQMGESGRRYVEKYYSREKQAAKIEKKLLNILETK